MKTNKIIAKLHYSEREITIRMNADLHINCTLVEAYNTDCDRMAAGYAPQVFSESQIKKLRGTEQAYGTDYIENFYIETKDGERRAW